MTSSVVQRVMEAGDQYPDRPAILEKRLGRWHTITAGQVASAARSYAAGIRAAGFGAGDTVAVVLDNHADAVSLDLGIMCAGAVALQIPPRIDREDLASIFNQAAPRLVVVQGQHEADDVLDLIESGEFTGVETVAYVDPAGVSEYGSELLAPVDSLRSEDAHPDPSQIDVDAPAIAVVDYTGTPRLVTHTHRALQAGVDATTRVFGIGPEDRVVITRPFGDAPERAMTVYPTLVAGGRLAFPESRATVAVAIHEVAPTYVHMTTRYLKSLANDLLVRLSETKGTKSLVAGWWGRRTGASLTSYGSEQGSSGLSRAVVGHPALHKVGLDGARVIAVSGEPRSDQTLGFIRNMGVRVEALVLDVAACGPIMVNDEPVLACAVGEGGTLTVSGPAAGGAGEQAVATGLVARESSAGIELLGRKGASLVVEGTEIPARRVERSLASSPMVMSAAAVAEGDDVHVAVELARGPAARWAQQRRHEVTTYQSLTRIPELIEFVNGLVLDAVGKDTNLHVHLATRPWAELPNVLTPGGEPRRRLALEASQGAGAASDTTG